MPETPGTASRREAALVGAFVYLADTMAADYDVVDFIQQLCERCVEVLEISAAGVLLDDGRGQLTVLAATSAQMRALEVFELQRAEGPCAEAFTSGELVTAGDLTEARERWPSFVPLALEVGFLSALAVPMSLRDQRIGALNLFSDEVNRFDEADLVAAQGLCAVAAIGILHERAAREQQDLTGHLQRALDSRVLLEQAKGALAERLGIRPDEAFELLRRYARPRGLKLSVVARDALSGTLPLRDLEGASRPSG